MQIRNASALALCLLVGLAAPAATAQLSQASPSPAQLRQGLAGRWTGALGYRDYQSNALFELPVETTIEVVPDGATIVRRSLFDDGPGKPVWITTVSLDDREAETIRSVSFRSGRDLEVLDETVSIDRYGAGEDWTLVYVALGNDDDAPAEIRVTETRSGDALTAVKEVRPIGGGETAWTFRNRLRLTKRGADPSVASDTDAERSE